MVVQPEGVKECGVEIVDGDYVTDGTISKIIRLTVDITVFDLHNPTPPSTPAQT